MPDRELIKTKNIMECGNCRRPCNGYVVEKDINVPVCLKCYELFFKKMRIPDFILKKFGQISKRPCFYCQKSTNDWLYIQKEKKYICSKCYELKKSTLQFD